ncbi:MAG TPA: toll/interleukin-1 receptor domain-containing protein, partial [Xanthomonadaceae bacterium]|nr:toll/interleukin-1 receptor domain-containing protein [Xanthomonadaceae bacterium]
AEAFVAELHERWSRRQRPASTSNGSSAPQRFMPPSREMPENAIFISYAREDLPAVQRLKAAMDAAGLTTWFDLDRLEGGDDYDRKIRANIARCSFFLPVISATTQRRHEAYFRREWSYAVDRARNIADGAVFILPVCIDDTPESAALVPEQFKALHMVRVAGGEPPPEFLRRLQDLFSGRRA